jgi:hypothetical protein
MGRIRKSFSFLPSRADLRANGAAFRDQPKSPRGAPDCGISGAPEGKDAAFDHEETQLQAFCWCSECLRLVRTADVCRNRDPQDAVCRH